MMKIFGMIEILWVIFLTALYLLGVAALWVFFGLFGDRIGLVKFRPGQKQKA